MKTLVLEREELRIREIPQPLTSENEEERKEENDAARK